MLPFFARVDLRFVQDFIAKVGKRSHTLQFTADILNFPNMLNKNWGYRTQVALRNPLSFAGYDAAGRPTFRMTQVGGQLLTSPTQITNSVASTWGMQLGLRYIF